MSNGDCVMRGTLWFAEVKPRETCKSELENKNLVIGQSEIQKDKYLNHIGLWIRDMYRIVEARPIGIVRVRPRKT